MKSYFNVFLLLVLFGLSFNGYAQKNATEVLTEESIESLSIYPNPVSNGKIYITTKQNFTKEIEIFDVLGKKVQSTSLFGKELNISKLTPGIYILKIREKNSSATRKLVVR